MKKLWKNISLGLVLSFLLTIFAPYSALADEVLAPSLSMDTDGNYTISSVADLNTLRSDIDKGLDYSGKCVKLNNDIDITNGTSLNFFKTNNSFNGTFDGSFHTISGYTDTKSGLFGIVNKDGVVKNVRIDANVVISDRSAIIASRTSSYYYGLIANESAGIITRCFTTGTIQNTINGMFIAGIVGTSSVRFVINGKPTYIKGKVADCYSNVIFDNKGDSSSPTRAGICAGLGTGIEHCYFYGKFLGIANNSGDGYPIINTGDMSTCAYDKDVLGSTAMGTSIGYTTEEMKNKDSYTALGFDFNKTWKIDSSVNGGYPYLNPENLDKVATQIIVDVQLTVADKTYNTNSTVEDNLKTTVTGIKVIPESSEDEDLITSYNVTATYDGDILLNAPTIGDVPVNIDSSKLKITYDQNDDYQFVIGKVLSINGKLLDDGTAGPTEDEKKQQIQDAIKAEDIVYKSLNFGQGDISEFTWSGDKATNSGEEGTIVFNYAWEVFSTARSGWTGVREGFYDDWFKSIQDGLQKMKDEGIDDQDVKMTEWEKLVLAITAIGYDPRDIKAYDLIDIISNEDYLKVSKQYFSKQYAVLALNSYNYAVPQDENFIDKDALIHDWAANALGTTGADGSAVLSNSVGDMWLMAFQPIAAYYDPNAKEGDKYYDVKQAMDHVFNQFANAQTYIGSFYGGYSDDYNNPYTNAQVYMTLGMANVNIFDKKYVKNGNSIIAGALAHFDLENGKIINGISNYEPAQICRGLDSLVRAYEGRNSIFDCTDVTDSTVPVNNAILALPDSITSANKTEVDAAQALYDALSDAKKASIKESTKAKLAAAQEVLSSSDKPVAAVAAGITTVEAPAKNSMSLSFPTVPEGYTISIKTSDKTGVIGTDGTITPPETDTTVALVFTVTNTTDNSIANTASINVVVPAKDDTNIDKTLGIVNLTDTKEFELGNDAKITMQATNNGSEAKEVTLVVGLYDNSGTLIKYEASERSIDPVATANLKVTLKVPQEGTFTVKGFMCNSLEEMTPISYTIDIPVENN